MATILVVDDEKPLTEAISYNLNKEGFSTLTAADAEQGMSLARTASPDLVVLDVMMPSGSGFDICRQLRKEQDCLPIILLTARTDEMDRLRGFEMGADDYVVKPFLMRELMARVRALLRRSQPRAGSGSEPISDEGHPVYDNEIDRRASWPSQGRATSVLDDRAVCLGNLEICPAQREVYRDDKQIDLSRKEFDLLLVLATNRGQVFDRQTLLDRVWGEDCYVDERTVDVHIRWLREKIEDSPARPERLLTVRGVGYKFCR